MGSYTSYNHTFLFHPANDQVIFFGGKSLSQWFPSEPYAMGCQYLAVMTWQL